MSLLFLDVLDIFKLIFCRVELSEGGNTRFVAVACCFDEFLLPVSICSLYVMVVIFSVCITSSIDFF